MECDPSFPYFDISEDHFLEYAMLYRSVHLPCFHRIQLRLRKAFLSSPISSESDSGFEQMRLYRIV